MSTLPTGYDATWEASASLGFCRDECVTLQPTGVASGCVCGVSNVKGAHAEVGGGFGVWKEAQDVDVATDSVVTR